jgi:signal transduction histidine kinase
LDHYDETVSRRALRPYAVNAVLAFGLAGASLVGGMDPYGFGGPARQKGLVGYFGDVAGLRHAVAVWWLLSLLIVTGLLIQHRWPPLALLLIGSGAIGHTLQAPFGVQPLDLAVPIVLYTVASLSTDRRTSIAALVAMLLGEYLLALCQELVPITKAMTTAQMLATAFDQQLPTNLAAAASRSFQVMVVLMLAFALGDGARSRRAHLRTIEQRAADLERDLHQQAALAVAAERARITREMHDVVAHGLSVMVMQAQGSAAAQNRHPERAAAALQQVISTGRACMAEMRRLLGVISRDPTNDPRLDPQPGVAAVPDLVDRVRAAGTAVHLRIAGDPVPLPASVDLSAYRIVQEALTNTLKHAGANSRATVRLTFTAEQLQVEITDDGMGDAPNPNPNAQGLRGIAERVSMLGGQLTAGPVETGGFQICALLPFHAGT